MQESPFWQSNHQLQLEELPCGFTQAQQWDPTSQRTLESPTGTTLTQKPSLHSADNKSHINKLPVKETKLLLLIMAGNFSPCSNTGAASALLAPYHSGIYFYIPQQYVAISRGNTN